VEPDAPDALELGRPRGKLEVRDVSFGYVEGQTVLDGVSFCAQPGQRIAIVGPTGAGKTTIMNLFLRFYDPREGTIYLDDVDISRVRTASLRRAFGMVLQESWIFQGTVADNIAYGRPDATEAEVHEAAKRAHIDRFIRSLPNGYDTVINEETTNISGGQKQLLTIARAYLANRPILILDEATSNVDTRTEILIQRTMDDLMKDRTSFVIAHRLSTIVDADTILVVNHGSIVEQGTHQQLLEKNGFYAEIYNSQYELLN
jgi:ATP-binding cassette subfamily B protein